MSGITIVVCSPPFSAATTTSPFSITVESDGSGTIANGTLYAVQLRAVNAAGTGPATASTLVAPRGAPDAPTGASTTPVDGGLRVQFTLGSDGGSPITDIEYQLDGGAWVSAGALSSPITIRICRLSANGALPPPRSRKARSAASPAQDTSAPDATTAQAFLAGATSRIRPLSMVTLLPLHHPIVAAKAIATLDWFSGGRALIAIGIGWDAEEFDILGVPFAKRGQRADEYLAAMFELWDSEEASFEGEFVSFRGVLFGPKPVQRPHPPIWIGGDADGALRRAARFGDGWAPWLTTPEQFPARLDFLRSQPGFDDRPFEICYNPDGLVIGERHVVRDDRAAPFGRTATEEIDRCGGLADLGVTMTSFLPPPVRDLEEYLDYLRWAAEDVVPHVR